MRTCRGEAPPSCCRKTVLSLKSPTGAFIVPLRSTNANLLFSYGGTAIVFKTTNRNYTIIFITHNENGIISYFPTCCAVFTGIRLPPYLSKLVNMIPRQKAINIGFTHFCDCRQSGKIVVAFVIVVSIKPRRYTYRKNQDDYSYNRSLLFHTITLLVKFRFIKSPSAPLQPEGTAAGLPP